MSKGVTMELLGIWKLKEFVTADENGLRMIGVKEIEEMEDSEENREFKQMLRTDFILSEASLDLYYKPLESELEMAKEEGWEITEKGILMESYPAKIENGLLLLNYEKEGNEYFPVEIDEEGCIAISGGILKIQKAQL